MRGFLNLLIHCENNSKFHLLPLPRMLVWKVQSFMSRDCDGLETSFHT